MKKTSNQPAERDLTRAWTEENLISYELVVPASRRSEFETLYYNTIIPHLDEFPEHGGMDLRIRPLDGDETTLDIRVRVQTGMDYSDHIEGVLNEFEGDKQN